MGRANQNDVWYMRVRANNTSWYAKHQGIFVGLMCYHDRIKGVNYKGGFKTSVARPFFRSFFPSLVGLPCLTKYQPYFLLILYIFLLLISVSLAVEQSVVSGSCVGQ